MIKVNEIRSGNIFYDTKTGKYVTLNFTITHHVTGQLALSDLKVSGVKSLSPIPLTEEWLLKFGFEKMNFKNCFSINEKPFEFKVEYLPKEDFIIFRKGNENPQHAPCKYVHRLQNLYFALTGEELTVKEPQKV